MRIERVSVLQLRSRLNTGKESSNSTKLLSQSYSAVGPNAESPYMFLNSMLLFATPSEYTGLRAQTIHGGIRVFKRRENAFLRAP